MLSLRDLPCTLTDDADEILPIAFHSGVKMNATNWPAPNVRVFIAQLVEHCSIRASHGHFLPPAKYQRSEASASRDASTYSLRDTEIKLSALTRFATSY